MYVCDVTIVAIDLVMPPANEPYVAIFDIETVATINEIPGGSRDAKMAGLPVSCASVLCIPCSACGDPDEVERAIEAGSMKTYWRDTETPEKDGMPALVKALDRSELIVGYNILGFDFPVIKKHYNNSQQYISHLLKAHDVFYRVREVSGYWPKLDALLTVNRMACKTSHGLEAINMWNEGRLEELKTYCEADVRQTARIALMKKLRVDHSIVLPNHVFGVSSKLASMRHSDAL